MATYRWNRYNVNATPNWGTQESYATSRIASGDAKSFSWDGINFVPSGGYWSGSETINGGQKTYSFTAAYIYEWTADNTQPIGDDYNYHRRIAPVDKPLSTSKGSLNGQVTSTSRTAYPDNGINSDGYWYEYVGIKNTAPTTPGAFTSPTGTLKGGISTTVSFGASSDAEGNVITYEVDASFDNGATYSNVYSGSAVSFTYSVPTNKTQVKFRVRAKDSLNAFSGYTHSSNLTISQNSAPTVTLNTTDNATLYENSTYKIDGYANDADNGNFVNIKYQLDGGQTRALETGISNGANNITFNKQLTFKNGKLFDGETVLTEALAEGSAHQLKVWADDDKGGKSAEQIRNFYVVPNRVPVLSVDQVTPSGIIDSDKFTITGSCSDPDGNEVAVAYKINGGLSKEIYRGKDSAWNFEVSLKELVVGENAIVVEVTDSYNFKTSKTIKLNKNEVKTPILQSVARYKITPPKSTAKGVLLWIQRGIGLSIDAEISMTLNGEQEQYVAMPKTNTAPINSSTEEDEFTYEASEAKENIIVKLKLTRESADVSDAITLISGVLS